MAAGASLEALPGARLNSMSNRTKYLIVGGGVAADAAVRSIRTLDRDGPITLLSAERHPPYDRPPLTKKLWAGNPIDEIWRHTDQAGVDLRLETIATGGDPASHRIIDSRGTTHVYEKLLIATGGVPRRLPVADPGVVYFRNLDDYQHVRALAERKSEFVVIGGGFIGSEISAALASIGCRISLVFPAPGIGAGIFPSGLSRFLNDYYHHHGIAVFPNEAVTGVVRSHGTMTVTTVKGRTLRADCVIAGIGIVPDMGLATSLGLDASDGIEVDEHLRTSHPDIYAAGDVANFYNHALARRMRVEHEDNAVTMGTVAGRNMAGQAERYNHIPYFYSDLFDLGYEAVGRLSPNLQTVEDWEEPFRKGVIYYTEKGRIQGVLLWNIWDQLDRARGLLGCEIEARPEVVGY